MSSEIFKPGLFKDTVAIVTGGGTGIGQAITRELAMGGAKVIIASRKEKHIIPAAKGLSRDLEAEITPIVCNIREQEQIEALVDNVLETHGRIDYLINNGGGQYPSPAQGITEKGWRAVIDTNLTGTWHMCQMVANNWMLENGGRIVNIVADMWRGFPMLMHTGAARAAVVNMTKTLAVEWASAGILINCVAPGTILSSGMRVYPPGTIDMVWKRIPVKRMGEPHDVARATCFLLSPGGDFITGTTLNVDGGGSLWGDTWPIPDPPESPTYEIPLLPEEQWPEFAIDGEDSS